MSVKNDGEFLQNEYQKLMQVIRNESSKWEKQTLKEYILRAADLLERQIEHKILDIDISGISSYLYKELIKQECYISNSHFYEILPDKYKRNYSKSPETGLYLDSEWKIIIDDEHLIEKDQYDNFRIDGKPQQDKPEMKKTDVTQDYDSSDIKHESERMLEFDKYPILRILDRYDSLLDDIKENIQEIVRKYKLAKSVQLNTSEELGGEQKEIIRGIESHFTKDQIKESDRFIDAFVVEQRNNKKLLDWRLRIGRYEKLIAKVMMKNDHFIHQIAKMLHCSAKHLKNSVLNEPIEADLKKFRVWHFKCSKCKNEEDVDVADEINKQLERADLQEVGLIS